MMHPKASRYALRMLLPHGNLRELEIAWTSNQLLVQFTLTSTRVSITYYIIIVHVSITACINLF